MLHNYTVALYDNVDAVNRYKRINVIYIYLDLYVISFNENILINLTGN